MKTILITILVVAVIAVSIYTATKYFNLFSDRDADGIPDEVEDTIEEAKAKVATAKKAVRSRAKRVKEELTDVAEAAKDVVEQVKDVADAAKGKPRRGRKPAAKKTTKK